MHLGKIDEGKYAYFAKKHFTDNGKQLEDGVVEKVCMLSKNITWYMQKLMNTLFAATEQGGKCTVNMVDEALAYILDSQAFGYREQMFRLPEKQGRVLIAIAKEGEAAAVTSGAFIRKHRLSSASTVQSALRGLLEKDYVTQEQGHYAVYDVFLSYWIVREY